MFISQLSLNTRKKDVHRDLSSPYEMHRTLLRAFPDQHHGGTGRVMFRVDISRDESRPPTVLVQSEKQPDWTPLQKAGYADVHGVKQLIPAASNSTTVSENVMLIRSGDQFRFRLFANPTVKRQVEGKKNGRREACVTEEQQLTWLVRKGQAGGFTILQQLTWLVRKGQAGGFTILVSETDEGNIVPACVITPSGRMMSHRRKDDCSMTHFGVYFDGCLQVTDASQFALTLASGLGSAKAFGFRLLSIAPL